ncbi:MAG: discoidin domain-containing protein [Muribaculaceae bacterium]|nr:discoidin domain-containing protein [Muribaculaceae bacterium]
MKNKKNNLFVLSPHSFLLVAIMLVFSVTAKALPFVPTTDPSASDTKWYHLKTEGFYVVGGQYSATVSTSSSNNNDYQWCFVGTESTGYKVYNKQYGKYLGDEGYMISLDTDEEYMIVFYKPRTANTFYLMHTIKDNGANLNYYLYYDAEEEGLATHGTTGNDTRGCFEAVEAGNTPQSTEWTRYDTNGVGYKYIDGGTSPYANESSDNLSDNDASTKFCGSPSNLWVIIEASKRVPVYQYSIVTANDSRQYPTRALRSWKLQGSNDNANWDDIDVRTDCPLMPFADQEEVLFYIGGGTTYRYFKFTCTAGAKSDISQISEIWINGQQHYWASPTVTQPTCGVHGTKVYFCNDCHSYKTEIIEPTGNHNYVDGVCSLCGKKENEIILLDNGQANPYKNKFLHQYRNNNGTWPAAPNGWNTVNFNDNGWEEMTMPTASVGHSGSPFTSLIYNSYWYGEYNSYLFRRTFNLDKVDANATYTFSCVHDDNMVVYVNGQEVINAEGWTETPNNCTWNNAKEEFNIPASAFQAGKNVLAIYMQQNFGGTYFDCDLRMSAPSIVQGDVNGDGVVTAADVTALYDYLLSNDTSNLKNGDQNCDGSITAADVTAVYDILLGI